MTHFLYVFLVLFTEITLLWLLSLRIKDASIIDIFWGFGFVNAAVVCVLVSTLHFDSSLSTMQWLFAALVVIWGMRLTLHLGVRNIGKGEDYRYVLMRKKRGQAWWILSYPLVFLLQLSLILIISLPIYWVFINDGSRELGAIDLIACLLWAIGFLFESVGDYQLKRFKENRSGPEQILNTGLWKYTRHPNYFGDALQWWAFFLFALPLDNGWITVISPIIMTFFLIKVSGVAMLEKGLQKTKPHYAEYIANTPAFIPWFPKSS